MFNTEKTNPFPATELSARDLKNPKAAARIRKRNFYQARLREYWMDPNYYFDPEHEDFFRSYDFSKYYLPGTEYWVEPEDRYRQSPFVTESEPDLFPPKRGEKFDISAITSIKFK